MRVLGLDRLYFKWQKFADIDHTLDKEGNENDGNDEDDGNTTGHFTLNPYYNSTSGPSGDQHKMTTMNREGEKAPEAAETFFIDGDSLEKSRITMNERRELEGTSLRESEKHLQEVWIHSQLLYSQSEQSGVVVSALTKGLKFVVKGVGNGFKTLGGKVAGIG
ncbi:hypothetical protein pdam_00013223 [Pocillopora damicornis]|uniref:Uncharacterized protein n=1 Tax=Pocillopora damicornis TaxID=46731 RepID=A0A3M6UB03_POCDA|nr:hypothetical protein pdam_00013223 [Pocillopora damicornis]